MVPTFPLSFALTSFFSVSAIWASRFGHGFSQHASLHIYRCGSPRRRGDAPRTIREVKAASASLRDYSSTRRLAMSQSWQTGIFNQRDRSLPVCVGRPGHDVRLRVN